MTTQTDFPQYLIEWLTSVQDGSPSTTELGHRFGRKIITQWLDLNENIDELIYCDGAGDGGIDLAYLQRADIADDDTPEKPTEGHVWYLVQSKYGTAFQGTNTLLEESQKVIDTLDGRRNNLSSLAQGLQNQLSVFRQQAGELDRLVLVFATETPLTEPQKRVLTDIRAMGRNRLGPLFDVEAVSVATIFQRIQEGETVSPITLPITAQLSVSGRDLLVGAVSLLSLYDFLKTYRTQSGDLDQLYEKNVRRFLGNRGKVNKNMQQTLQKNPEQFGLFNNGITIVVQDFEQEGPQVLLTEPFVVNGCQTTRTIWEVFHQRLEAGGTGTSLEQQNWRKKAEQGAVVTKIVKVGAAGDTLLQDITRYTNSQNAVREKDFLALTSDFKQIARQMAEQYGVFLETQRGGWDSQSAYQRQHPGTRQFTEHTNAFDLLKVYGAGWLGEPGTAYGRNAAFLPNGTVFKRIINTEDTLTVDDFYAAFRVQKSADTYRFGRGAETARRQTRFLFYMILLDILKGIMSLANIPTMPKNTTTALLALYEAPSPDPILALTDTAIEAVDEYMSSGSDESIFREPAFLNAFNNDLNGYLKWEKLGKDDSTSPMLKALLAICKQSMKRGTPSPRDLILNVIKP